MLEPAEMFARACRYAEFDITELSFSSYMRMVDMGDKPYIAVPAFLSRAFRHSSLTSAPIAASARLPILPGARSACPNIR